MNTYLKTLALACALTSFTFAGEINPSSAATGSSAPVAAPATASSLPTTPTIIDYKSIDSSKWDMEGLRKIDTDEYNTKPGYIYDYYDANTYSMFQNRRDDAMNVFNINFDNKRMYNDSKYNAENIVLINKMYDYINYLTSVLEQKNDELSTKNTELSTLSQQKDDEYNQKIAKKDNEYQELQDKYKTLEGTIKDFTNEGKTFWENASNAAFAKIEKDLYNQIQNQLLERNKLNDATKQVQELTQKQQDLQTKLNNLSSENTTLQNNNSELQTNNDSLKAANEQLQADIDRLQEENNRLTEQNNSFSTQENDSKVIYGLLIQEQQKNTNLKYENSKLRQEIKQKDEEISSIEQTPYIEKNDTDDEEYYDIQNEESPTESETKTSPTPQENNTPYQQPTHSFVYDPEQFNTPTNPAQQTPAQIPPFSYDPKQLNTQESPAPETPKKKPTKESLGSDLTDKQEIKTESRPIKSRNKNRPVWGF